MWGMPAGRACGMTAAGDCGLRPGLPDKNIWRILTMAYTATAADDVAAR